MSKWTTKQAWKRLVWRRGVIAVGLATGFLSALTFLWDEFFPDLGRPHLNVVVKTIHWWYWAILGLIVMIIMVVQEAKKAVNAKHDELETEQAKNQRPEYQGRIYDVFIGPSAYTLTPENKSILVSADDSILILNVGIMNLRSIGNHEAGTSIGGYRMTIEVDGKVYEGRKKHFPSELRHVLYLTDTIPGSPRMQLDIERDSLAHLYYLHEHREQIAFYIDGLKYEPKRKQRGIVRLNIVDPFGDSHPAEPQERELIYGRVTCERRS